MTAAAAGGILPGTLLQDMQTGVLVRKLCASRPPGEQKTTVLHCVLVASERSLMENRKASCQLKLFIGNKIAVWFE